jgi:hypothetical protein
MLINCHTVYIAVTKITHPPYLATKITPVENTMRGIRTLSKSSAYDYHKKQCVYCVATKKTPHFVVAIKSDPLSAYMLNPLVR